MTFLKSLQASTLWISFASFSAYSPDITTKLDQKEKETMALGKDGRQIQRVQKKEKMTRDLLQLIQLLVGIMQRSISILKKIIIYKSHQCKSFEDDGSNTKSSKMYAKWAAFYFKTSDTYSLHQLQCVQKIFLCQKAFFTFSSQSHSALHYL